MRFTTETATPVVNDADRQEIALMKKLMNDPEAADMSDEEWDRMCTGVTKKKYRRYTMNGKPATLQEIAEAHGLSVSGLYHRMRRNNCSWEEAVKLKPKKGKNIYMMNGEPASLQEIADAHGIKMQTLLYRMRRFNIPWEEAVKLPLTDKRIIWKGRRLSLYAIAREEDVSYSTLRRCYHTMGMSLGRSLEEARRARHNPKPRNKYFGLGL